MTIREALMIGCGKIRRGGWEKGTYIEFSEKEWRCVHPAGASGCCDRRLFYMTPETLCFTDWEPYEKRLRMEVDGRVGFLTQSVLAQVRRITLAPHQEYFNPLIGNFTVMQWITGICSYLERKIEEN